MNNWISKLTREEALEQGRDRYFSGSLCIHGHFSERYTRNKECIQCHKKAMVSVCLKRKEKALKKAALKKQFREETRVQREAAQKIRISLYRKEWSEKNKEKIKAVNKLWVMKNLERVRTLEKEWRKNNPEKVRAYSKAWAERNPEKEKLKHIKRYYKDVELAKQKNKEWRKANPERCREYYHNYMSLKKQRGTLSKNIVKILFQKQKGCCACCGKWLTPNFHLDHIIPLCKNGTNTDDNVQLLRKKCNLQKSSRLPEEFLKFKQLGVIQP